MKIYLVRHGDSLNDSSDDERRLSEKGITDVKKIAAFINPLKLSAANIIHSPKIRAKETAILLSAAFSTQFGFQVHRGLDPMGSVSDFADEINELQSDLLIVGHMPFMGNLVSYLITGREHQNIVKFKTGTLVALEQLEDKKFIIRWAITPSLLP